MPSLNEESLADGQFTDFNENYPEKGKQKELPTMGICRAARHANRLAPAEHSQKTSEESRNQ